MFSASTAPLLYISCNVICPRIFLAEIVIKIPQTAAAFPTKTLMSYDVFAPKLSHIFYKSSKVVRFLKKEEVWNLTNSSRIHFSTENVSTLIYKQNSDRIA